MMKNLLTIFSLLIALACCTSEAERKQMRTGLDSINLRNRNSQPFTASEVQPYVEFFDCHGDANDQTLAYYLLGRAYHEQGEAPMALHYYHQAIDHADTTSSNCDFSQLSRVYSQIASVFYGQGLYSQQLVNERKAGLVGYRSK